MSSFSYGNAGNNGFSRYYMLEPYQGQGYYPMDHFESMEQYTEARQVDGVSVYGVLLYSTKLSQEQLDAYELYEASDVLPAKTDVQSQTEALPVTDVNYLVLEHVPAKFVFPTKNPAYQVVSVQTRASESGYGNIVLPAASFEQQEDGSFDVSLGRADMWRNVSVKKNGGYEQVRMDVKEIHQHYLEQQSVYQMNKKPEATSASVTSAYLNYVSSQFFYPTKNPDYSIVSIPYDKSENGFAKVTVPNSRITQTVNGKTKNPVPGMFSVNLGDPDGMVVCSVKQNGAYGNIYMKASELGAIHLQKRQSYLQQKRDAMVHTADTPSEPSVDVPVDEDDMVFA